MTSPAVRVSYAIVVAFIACVAIAGASVVYTNHVQRESDRRWCALLVDIGTSQRQTPPRTDSGRSFAAEIDKLRREFGCPTG